MNKTPRSIGPWTVLSETETYANPWITVTHAEVVTPGATRGVYGTVHFRNLAIAVLPLDQERHTWLVGQHRYPLDRYSWEVPEGGCPLGREDPLATAQRELKEETGVVARRWDKLLELDMSNSVTDERAIAYVARDLTVGEAEPESTEQLAVRRVPFIQAYQMVLDGEITDALSVATILRAQLWLTGI